MSEPKGSSASQPHDLYEAEHLDRRTARTGLALFLVYLVVYATFVALSAFARNVMATRVRGVNVAVIYGFFLIVFPFALAGLYLFLTRNNKVKAVNGGAK
ncbi:MAG: DUF485 domain-containing protein [Tepidisphaeraceae bacterium]